MKNNAMIEKSGGTTCIRRVLASIRVFHCWLELLIALHLYATKRAPSWQIYIVWSCFSGRLLSCHFDSSSPPAFSRPRFVFTCNDIVALVSRNRKLFTWAEDPSPVGRIMDAEIVSEIDFLFFFFRSFFHIYSLVSINLYPLLLYILMYRWRWWWSDFKLKFFESLMVSVYDIGLFFTFDYLFIFYLFY